MRYIIAAAVACVLVAAGVAFVWHTRAQTARRFEEFKGDLLAKRDAGNLPVEWQGVDVDQLEFANIKMQVTAAEMTKISITRWLSKLGKRQIRR